MNLQIVFLYYVSTELDVKENMLNLMAIKGTARNADVKMHLMHC
jgi:hypothetical protein